MTDKEMDLVRVGDMILGAILLDPETVMSRLNRLKGLHFHRGYQADLFILLRMMYETGAKIDLVTVKDRAIEFGTARMFDCEKKMVLWLMVIEEEVPSPFKISEWREALIKEKGNYYD
jgi:replicative DNA helicase